MKKRIDKKKEDPVFYEFCGWILNDGYKELIKQITKYINKEIK